jgi:hypothetical protein
MSKTIKVPDIPAPRRRLCWKQGVTLARCDRMYGHSGPHTWEFMARATCRVCGCTEYAPCPGGCSWVDSTHTLCSACCETAPLVDPKDQHRPHDEALVLFFSGVNQNVTGYLVRPGDLKLLKRAVMVYCGRSMIGLTKVIDDTILSSQNRKAKS